MSDKPKPAKAKASAPPTHGNPAASDEAFFCSAFENAAVGLAQVGFDGSLLRANTRCAEIFGYSIAELQQLRLRDLTHPNDRDAHALDVKAFANSAEDRAQFQQRCVRKDGSTVWVSIALSLERDGVGKPRHLLAVIQDIGAQRGIEEQLRESEARLLAALDHLPVGVWFADANGKILFGNPAGQQIWRGARYVGPEEFHEYKAWWDDTGEPVAPDDWAVARAIRNGETSLNEVLRIQCFDGSMKTILNSAVPMRDNEGAIIGAAVLNEDITEQRNREKAFRESQERLRLATEVAGIGLWHWDLHDDRLFFTDQYKRLTGFGPSDDVTVDMLVQRIHPEHRAAFQEAVDRSSATVGDVDMEFRILWQDGCVRWLLANGKTLPGSDGLPALSIGAVMDITNRKEHEIMLRDFTQELERLVARRTEEVKTQRDQLRALAVQLGRVEERERKRIGEIIHDHVQQALVASQIQLDHIKRGIVEADLRDRVIQVEAMLKEATAASKNLTLELSPPVLYESGLKQGLQWLSARMLRLHGFRVHVVTQEDSEPQSEESRFLLFECIRELLFNALKHSGVREASVEVLRMPDAQIRVTVTDGGKGFTVNHLDGRSANETTFGLFSIQERLTHIGGSVRIDSSPGNGTRVTLEAPSRVASLHAKDAPARTKTAQAETAGQP